jgi:hypothetical protein
MVGAAAIGKFLGFKATVVFHLANGGKLPLFKFGGRWAARKSTLRAHVADLEKAGV